MRLADWPPPAGKLAGKIAGMFNVLSGGIHPFIPGVGLVVYAGVPDAPTCEGLVCLAEALGVPCERHRVSGGRQLCGACGRCTWAYVSRRGRGGRHVYPRVDAVPPPPAYRLAPPVCSLLCRSLQSRSP